MRHMRVSKRYRLGIPGIGLASAFCLAFSACGRLSGPGEPDAPQIPQTAASFPASTSDANPADSLAVDSARVDPTVTLERVDKVTLEGGFHDPD
jgi:hypothetical protein